MTKGKKMVKIKTNQSSMINMKQKNLNLNSSFQTNKEKDLSSKNPEKQSIDALKKCHEVLRYLEKKYPKLFNRSQFKPLKKGIVGDVLAQGEFPFSHKRLRDALQLYVSLIRYLHCFQIYSERYDLEGSPCDILRVSEKEYAQRLLDTRLLKMREEQTQQNKTDADSDFL